MSKQKKYRWTDGEEFEEETVQRKNKDQDKRKERKLRQAIKTCNLEYFATED